MSGATNPRARLDFLNVEALKDVRQYARCRGNRRYVLEVIAGYSNQKNGGWAWPSITTLADATGFTRDTIIAHVAALVESGELEAQPMKGRVTRYRLRVTRVPAAKQHQSRTSTSRDSRPVETIDQSKTPAEPVENFDRTSRESRPEVKKKKEEGNEGEAPAPAVSSPLSVSGERIPRPSSRVPTEQEVRNFAAEVGMPPISADKFFLYYSAAGWKLADWRAKLRLWHLQDSTTANASSAPKRDSDAEFDAYKKKIAAHQAAIPVEERKS